MDKQTIEKNIKNVLTETNFEGLGEKKVGKVRDSYFTKDRIVMVTTDRYSAFDRILATIPFKGQVLVGTAAWWFEQTKDIIPNHMLEVPDPNVMVGQRVEALPVEIVPRAFLSGVTATSIWTNYQKGQREFGGLKLGEGLKKNTRLKRPILTPSTKFEEHDRNLTPEEIVKEGLMTEKEWDFVSEKSLELFEFGQKTALQKGLILVDTKYEFGKDEKGDIILIDEIHTPDSSRYWFADTFEARIASGEEPQNFDKEFLRLWFKENSDPYKDEKLPDAPVDMVVELSSRYIKIYETITGKEFVYHDEPVIQRIEKNLRNGGYLVE
ncbi:MAG: phosphoribosylaminoimidazolesuccinocarboxamide synthase [Candidatus Doudnabacteria bacterium CG10_big_fil_rev_8_21_14_0_10_41_10]|uniref:Phosphoribosylaminoimidazole-succinocarboxamide synthase n=1 Tax=Candidatus Doudnabacteria bacterium CG10_big_fil_rev_8_21_14_0_10_41_10 TaxID=1974551 RepID=A0A2H0VEC7_9BACT|nr:MAG: phosphoribosylaminoimidazolesuccinocarboxamide synthase [Candidatus Doudnabacteria bacterium CG10_big_fil_rev_8_21_14_0_10_41_10]